MVSKMKRIAVTGLGPISSLGIGHKEIWNSIKNSRVNLVKGSYSIGDEKWGDFYLHKMKRFDISDFKLPQKNFEFIKNMRTVREEDTDLYYLLAVIKLAIEDSGMKYDLADNNIGLVLSHENPGMEILLEELIGDTYSALAENKKRPLSKLEFAKMFYGEVCEKRGYNLQTFSYLFAAAKVFDLHGYSLFVNNACASGLFAIEAAAMQIKSGKSPAVVVAAADNPTKIYKYLWFKGKGLYAEDGILRPVSNGAKGTVFGDGGAALVLEDMDHARERGAVIYGEYMGGGFSLEGWKITVPNITDDFYTRSFKKALEVSEVRPDEIDFVNPHGVGLKITDTYEANTINSIFKEKCPAVSAFKPMVGHNLGGSALLETVIGLLAMKNSLVPATLNCENMNKELRLNIIKENTDAKIDIFAKMSCGFAGFNGVSIFKKV